MSLFKKPKKALQKNARIFTSEFELMEVAEDDGEKREAVADKQKKKDKKEKTSKSQKSSLLSFGDEGIRFVCRRHIYSAD